MRIAIASAGFAALIFFWCQNAAAVATTGTVIKEAAMAGSPPPVLRPLFERATEPFDPDALAGLRYTFGAKKT
jgi:hypothetical protein